MAENRFNSRPLVNSWEALPTDDARSESQSTNTFTTASTRSMRNMGDRPLPKPPFEIIVISQAVGGLKVDKSVLSCTVTIGSPWRFTFYCNKDQSDISFFLHSIAIRSRNVAAFVILVGPQVSGDTLQELLKTLSAESTAISRPGLKPHPLIFVFSSPGKEIKELRQVAGKAGAIFIEDTVNSVVPLEEIAYTVVGRAVPSRRSAVSSAGSSVSSGVKSAATLVTHIVTDSPSALRKHPTHYSRVDAGLTMLPAELLNDSSAYSTLRSIDLSYNHIATVSPMICEFKLLKSLNLSGNILNALPISICSLTSLKELDLSNNSLFNLPSEVSKLKLLAKLNLSGNKIDSIPSELAYLSLLQTLDLSKNKLNDSSFASSFRWDHMSSLTNLNLSENAFESLPQLYRSPWIKQLKLDGNPLTTIPPHLATNHSDLLEYLKQFLEDNQVQWPRIRLVVLGRDGSGRSTLVTALQNRLQEAANPTSSKMVNITSWMSVCEVLLGDWIFEIWDFGNKELFFPAHRIFLTQHTLYLLVYKLGDPKSIGAIGYWTRILQATDVLNRSEVLIVGTHADQVPDQVVLDTLKFVEYHILARMRDSRAIPSERLLSVALPPSGSSSSFSTRSRGVQEVASMLKVLGNRLAEKRGREIPSSWIALLWATRRKRSARIPIMHWTEWEDLAVICRVPPDMLMDATTFLIECGEIIHVDDAALEDIVILDPWWLADAYSCLLHCRASARSKGCVDLSIDVLPVWRGYDERHREVLINLLEKCELLYRLKSERQAKVLIPALLSEGQSLDEIISSADRRSWLIQRIYRFPRVPLGLFERLMVRLRHLIDQEAKSSGYWRNALLLEFPNSKQIVSAVEYFLSTFYQSISPETERLAVCGHCLSNGKKVPEASVFRIEDISAELAKGKLKISCQMPVSIAYLAPDLSMTHLPTIAFSELSIESELGHGASGQVFKAQYKDKVVAVKKIRRPEEEDSESFYAFLQELKSEASIMAKMNHPNLVYLYGVCMPPDLSLVMEFVEHGDLYKFIERSPRDSVSWRYRLLVALDIAKGMRYLHDHQLIHRDLRSPNIFLAAISEGQSVLAKVGDFGLAQMTAGEGGGGLLENWMWMAPETWQSKQSYSLKADVWSFAIILWELLAWRHPWDEVVQDARMVDWKIRNRIANEGLRPEIPSDLPAPFDSVRTLLTSGWSVESYRRPSFSDIVKSLSSLLGVKETESESRSMANVAPGYTTHLSYVVPVTAEDFRNLSSVHSLLYIHTSSTLWCGRGNSVLEVYHILRERDARLLIRRRLPASTGRIYALAGISKPNDQMEVWSSGEDGCIVIWNCCSFSQTASLTHHSKCVRCIKALSQMVITGDVSGKLIIWDAYLRVPLQQMNFSDPIFAVLPHPSGKKVWIAVDKHIHELHATTRSPQQPPSLPPQAFTTMSRSSRGIGIGSRRATINAAPRDSDSGEQVYSAARNWQAHRRAISCLCYCEATQELWSGSQDGTISVWNVKVAGSAANELRVFESDLTEKLFCLTPIMNGQYVVCGSTAPGLHIWNSETKCLDRMLSPTNGDGIRSLCHADCHRLFVSGGLDGIICMWRWVPFDAEAI